jgi:hypothetical protein
MARTLAALLDERAAGLPGRQRERGLLLRLLDDDGPLVAFVHGIAGIGKSALLKAFAADARARGARPVVIDGRSLEPTQRGVAEAIAAAAGAASHDLDAAVEALGALGERVVLVIDTYEQLGMVDGWLCRALVPALPANVRVLLAGREPPAPGWVRGYADGLLAVPLECLRAEDAEALLQRAGASAHDAAWLNQRARGHPLSLQLVAGALGAGRPARHGVGSAVDEVAREYLDALDPDTRRALEAAAITRRTTLTSLGAMLADERADEALARLRTLPFVELGPDGLVVHDTMRETVEAMLRASDPGRLRRYRQAAWHALRAELRQARGADAWRAMADLLYLVDDPLVRGFYFAASGNDHSTEPAAPGDWEAIREIALGQAPDIDLAALEAWWQLAPQAFVVARDGDGAISAFRCLTDDRSVTAGLVERDPVLRGWREHLRRDPVPRGQVVMFARFLAARDDCRWGPGGPLPSPGRAALLLEQKAQEVQRREEVRRVYAAAPSLAGAYGLCALLLGLEPLPGEKPQGDGGGSLLLDLGPGLMDGWLADLASRQLLDDVCGPLDPSSRELVLDGRRLQLTPLEFGVLSYLHAREGRVVERAELLREVWGHAWAGGSNVVDVVVSALRRKLASRAGALETVRGAGYRLGSLA